MTKQNNWIKLKPLLNEINQTLKEINNFNDKNTSLIIKDISLDLPCYIKKNNDSDLQIQIPDPDNTHNNSKILSKFRFNCNMVPLKLKENNDNNENFPFDSNNNENNDNFHFDSNIDEKIKEDEEGNKVYEESINYKNKYNMNSQKDLDEINLGFYTNYQCITTFIKK